MSASIVRRAGLPIVCALVMPLAAFFVLSINVEITSGLYAYDQQRIGQVAVLVVVAAMSAVVLASSRNGVIEFDAPSPPVAWAVCLFFALGATSAAHAASVSDAVLEWARFALLAQLAWTVGTLVRRDPRALSLVFLGSLLLAICWFTAARIGPYAAILALQLPLSSTAFLAGFDNPRFFGQMQTLTLPLLALPLLANGLSRRLRACLVALAVAWWMLAWLSGTRGTLYALLLTGVLAAVLWGSWGRRYVLVSSLLSAAGALAFWILFTLVPRLIGVPVEGTRFERSPFSLSNRDELWRLSFAQIEAHPWLGLGPMHFAWEPNQIAAHPHSIPLQLAAEWGMPAAVIILGTVSIALAGRAWTLRARLARPETRVGLSDSLDALLLVAIAAALVQGLVDGVLVTPYTETLLATLAGLAWGRASPPRCQKALPAIARWVVAVGLVACSVTLASITWDQTRGLDARIGLQESRSAILLPRFWSAGSFERRPASGND